METVSKHRPRWRSTRRLPSLRRLKLPLSSQASRTELMLKLLRQNAKKFRKEEAAPFYSIRAVATRFRMPTTTIFRLYQQLESEGLLQTIWGSKTMLQPDTSATPSKAQILSIPVSVAPFATSRQYRNSILRLCRQLLKETRFPKPNPQDSR